MIRETLDLDKNFPVFLTSAKEGTGIKDVISYIFSEIEKTKNQKENQT
jgi:GTP-binding protein